MLEECNLAHKRFYEDEIQEWMGGCGGTKEKTWPGKEEWQKGNKYIEIFSELYLKHMVQVQLFDPQLQKTSVGRVIICENKNAVQKIRKKITLMLEVPQS